MATLLVNAGKAIVTNRIKGSGTEPLNAAWGTGAGTTAAADTTLFTEATPRAAGTSTQTTTSVTNDTYQVVATITAGGALATYVTATADTDPTFGNNTWRIGNSSTTGLGDITYNQITIGLPTDGGGYALWPAPTAMSGTPASLSVLTILATVDLF